MRPTADDNKSLNNSFARKRNLQELGLRNVFRKDDGRGRRLKKIACVALFYRVLFSYAQRILESSDAILIAGIKKQTKKIIGCFNDETKSDTYGNCSILKIAKL